MKDTLEICGMIIMAAFLAGLFWLALVITP
jgi:hypothetical protein